MIDDDQLLLFYYDDGLSPDEHNAIRDAISRETEVADRYRTLQATLGEASDVSAIRAPNHLKYQWQEAITQAARRETAPTSPSRPKFLLWGSALAASLFVAFAIGTQVGSLDDNKTPAAVASAPSNDAFARGLQVHLQQASTLIETPTEATTADTAALVNQIVAQNRLFEKAAEANEAHDVARLMRAIEPVLVRLANPDVSPVEANALRLQVAFELNAVLTKIEQTASEVTETI
ncbi:MAG: hypothetical protein AAGJ86_04890 [Pseudomonadota bacterium]